LGLLGLVVLALGVSLGLLPQILGTAWARGRILAEIDRFLGPGGSLRVDAFAFSWTGPTRLTGFVLFNDQGQPVVSTREAVLDRSLWQLLTDRPRYGTLDLGPASVKVEQRRDGVVDLVQAMGPLGRPNPESELKIRIAGGSLELRSPELARPLMASRLDFAYDKPPAPRRRTFDVRLGGPSGGEGSAWLRVEGAEDHWAVTLAEQSDLDLTLTGQGWPLDLVSSAGSARAVFDGTVRARRIADHWATTGDARLDGLEAVVAGAGPAPVRVPRVAAQWDLAHGGGLDLAVRHLAIATTAGTLHADPTNAARDVSRIRGHLDLAALASLSPGFALPGGRTIGRGQAQVVIEAVRGDEAVDAVVAVPAVATEPTGELPAFVPPEPRPAPVGPGSGGGFDPEGLSLALQAVLPDLSLVGQGERLDVPPLELSVRARQAVAAAPGSSPRIELDRLYVKVPQGSAELKGSIDDPANLRLVDLSGTVDVEWEEVADWIAASFDPESMFDAEPVTLALKGSLGAGTTFDAALLDRLDWSLACDVVGADILGMRLGRTHLAARGAQGNVTVEPIHASLNGGTVDLRPVIERRPDGSWLARLEPGSSIQNAAVNEEVSDRVLSYVVPILEDATRVTGTLSASIKRAEFPIGLVGSTGPVVEGSLVFENVSFGPGPLARTLLAVATPAVQPELRLEQAIVLDIRDGRVFQHGLSIAVGKVVRITVDGSVGLDRTVDLVVSVPIQAESFQNVPIFNRVSRALRADIPIRGTLDEPKVDTSAFGRGMGRMGLDVANEATGGGVGLILDLIDANRQAMTPEERARREAVEAARRAEQERKRLERQQRAAEKKAERQMRRNGMP
jgi:hypothetical protein